MQFKEYTKEFTKRIHECIMHGSFNNRTITSDLMLTVQRSKYQNEEIELSLLVSNSDGTIFDAKFLCHAAPHVIGLCEILTENFIRKTYAQVKHINAQYIEKLVQDKTKQILGATTFSSINHVLEMIELITKQCEHIPVENSYLETPIEHSLQENCIEDFFEREEPEQLGIIKSVIEKEIQPYVALDEGHVEVKKIEEGKVTIKYSGSCTSCIAATGSTLSAIQNILKTCVHPHLSVQVDPSTLGHVNTSTPSF